MSEIELEQVNFNLNTNVEGGFHIHNSTCYVMFRENGAGLALINRALKPYQRPDKFGFVSSVGDAHEICVIREKLQALRFELL